jgi:beta-glucanase (GH16 family)
VGLVVCCVVLATVSGADASDAPTTAGPGPEVFQAAAHTWKPSANARVSAVKVTGGKLAGQVTPRRSGGRKSIALRSASSAISVPVAGSTALVTARVKTSQPGRRLRLRVVEVNDGRTVASRSASVVPSSRAWRTLRVTMRTQRPGSHLRLEASATRVSRKNFLRVSSVDVSVTRPEGGTGPTDPPTGTPAACRDLDYSDPDQGVLTFADEFDTGTLDPRRWRVRDDTFLNQDQAWISRDNVSVHPHEGTDGVLDIAGRKLDPAAYRSNANALYPGENTIRDYSTGYVDSIDTAGYGNAAGDRFGQKYGYFEVRAWVPSEATMSRGIWPAFWLRADHRAGEIDPMESYGGPTIRSFDPSSSYEWNSWADTAEGSMTGIEKQQTHGRADVGTDKIWQGWHRYAVNWSPTCLRYLYDGRTVGFVDFTDPATRSYFTGPSFDDTFHIRLNMQIGSKYWGWADDAHTRQDFHYLVDYVRVYQGVGAYSPN